MFESYNSDYLFINNKNPTHITFYITLNLLLNDNKIFI